MGKLIFIISVWLVFFNASAYCSQSVQKAKEFQAWLGKKEDFFLKCDPILKKDKIELCDGTKADLAELKKMFQLSAADLIQEFKQKRINVLVRCNEKKERAAIFQDWCEQVAPSQYFREVTSLHGQYLPEKNAIALNSDALLGSAVHEYIHYLQYVNTNKVFGRRYKFERISIQAKLISDLDKLIEQSKEFELRGEVEKAKKALPKALEIAEALQQFGYWQRLIDERNIFRTYILFSKELGISAEDIALAKKNMGFLCRDQKLKNKIPAAQCTADVNSI